MIDNPVNKTIEKIWVVAAYHPDAGIRTQAETVLLNSLVETGHRNELLQASADTLLSPMIRQQLGLAGLTMCVNDGWYDGVQRVAEGKNVLWDRPVDYPEGVRSAAREAVLPATRKAMGLHLGKRDWPKLIEMREWPQLTAETRQAIGDAVVAVIDQVLDSLGTTHRFAPDTWRQAEALCRLLDWSQLDAGKKEEAKFALSRILGDAMRSTYKQTRENLAEKIDLLPSDMRPRAWKIVFAEEAALEAGRAEYSNSEYLRGGIVESGALWTARDQSVTNEPERVEAGRRVVADIKETNSHHLLIRVAADAGFHTTTRTEAARGWIAYCASKGSHDAIREMADGTDIPDEARRLARDAWPGVVAHTIRICIDNGDPFTLRAMRNNAEKADLPVSVRIKANGAIEKAERAFLSRRLKDKDYFEVYEELPRMTEPGRNLAVARLTEVAEQMHARGILERIGRMIADEQAAKRAAWEGAGKKTGGPVTPRPRTTAG